MCLILFIVCKTQDDSVFYNIVRSAMAVNSFHDQIINFSWLNSCISQYYLYGDFLYFLKHMYIKIIGYFIFLLQFVRVFFANWLDYCWLLMLCDVLIDSGCSFLLKVRWTIYLSWWRCHGCVFVDYYAVWRSDRQWVFFSI